MATVANGRYRAAHLGDITLPQHRRGCRTKSSLRPFTAYHGDISSVSDLSRYWLDALPRLRVLVVEVIKVRSKLVRWQVVWKRKVIDSAAFAEVQMICNPPGLFADHFEAEPAVD